MDDPEYVIGIFDKHFSPYKDKLPLGFVTLELGPGDSIGSALAAKHSQSSRIYLVDVGYFAKTHLQVYSILAERLGLKTSSSQCFQSLEEILNFANATYLTNGLQSLQEMTEGVVEFAFSNAVLEHVRLNEFDKTIKQLYRVQTPGGWCSHQVDLKDHLQQSLNTLRFSRRVWESKLMAQPDFYTNRLRASQVCASFEAAGYEILEVQVKRWDRMPIPQKKIHREFADLSEDDLLTSSILVRARKPVSA